MAPSQTVSVGNRIIEFHTFTGVVLEEKKWTTTQVSGGGGGYNVGSGHQNPVTISSSTTTHSQFFLRDDAGQERAFEITDFNVAVRQGHRVTVLWGIIQGNPNGPYLAVCNHTTGDLTQSPSGVNALAALPMSTGILLAYIASFFAICLYGLGIVALIILMVQRSGQKKQMLAAVRSAVDSAIAQIKNQK